MIRIKAPTKGDERMLRYMLDKLHVAVGDAAVEELVRSRLSAAVVRSKGRLEVPERTIQAWVRAALAIHHANRDLYRAVASGDFL
jgi:hypothetical protein